MTINLAPALRGLGLCALAAALTTLLNTIAPLFYSASDFDGRMALIGNPFYVARQWVLLIHPAVTLLLALGLALALFERCTGRASAGLIFAGVEKMTEFVLGFLIIAVVNPVWKAGYLAASDPAVAPQLRLQLDLFGEIIGGLVYLLWTMFILSTALFALALDRHRGGIETLLFWSAAVAIGITVIMFFGDLFSLGWTAPVVSWLYPPAMTAHRLLAGLWLLGRARELRHASCVGC